MIYSYKNNNTLNYTTPLIDYLRKNNNYGSENLLYSRKYSDGTFSITNPTNNFCNAKYINGYPHFDIPLSICTDEINFFLKNEKMYDYNFVIRYGDLHPNKPIPKLGQLRNIILNNSLNCLIFNNVKSVFPIGDISVKSINSFKEKYNIGMDTDELFKLIVNNKLIGDIKNNFDNYNCLTIDLIRNYLLNLHLPIDEFIVESSLYENQKLYQFLKTNPIFKDFLKDNGEVKYSLQELMFINKFLKNHKDVLISIIGSNQVDHVIKVDNILNDINFGYDARFLTYGMCYNANEMDYNLWGDKLFNNIVNNKYMVNGNYIEPIELIKFLTIIVNNETDIDFNNIDKYKTSLNKMCRMFELSDINDDFNIEKNHLVHMMSLVNYNLNRSIEKGSVNFFYKYVLSIYNEYSSNADKYKNVDTLYNAFMKNCLLRLGLENDTLRRTLK